MIRVYPEDGQDRFLARFTYSFFSGKINKMTTIFQKKTWELVKKIPRGKVTTYGEIARLLGTSSRAVGNALGANPKLVIVPCHRIVKADGKLGGYAKGEKMKARLLRKEGVKVENGRIADFGKKFITPET